ncbi:MAG: flagellar FlbD family protein [Planctomycetes bacterium]|nr:flagellar FlbD family protein [Planctomycetota bacterium]
MIRLTRLNKKPFVLNAEVIKFLEETPDTVVTLLGNERVVVSEPVDEVVRRVIEYRRSLRLLPED